MSGYNIKYSRETRIERPGHPHKTCCGGCGIEVEKNQLLCTDCKAPQFKSGDSN